MCNGMLRGTFPIFLKLALEYGLVKFFTNTGDRLISSELNWREQNLLNQLSIYLSTYDLTTNNLCIIYLLLIDHQKLRKIQLSNIYHVSICLFLSKDSGMKREEGVISFFGLGLMRNALLVFKDYFIPSLKCEGLCGHGIPREFPTETERCLQKGRLHLIFHLGICFDGRLTAWPYRKKRRELVCVFGGGGW